MWLQTVCVFLISSQEVVSLHPNMSLSCITQDALIYLCVYIGVIIL